MTVTVIVTRHTHHVFILNIYNIHNMLYYFTFKFRWSTIRLDFKWNCILILYANETLLSMHALNLPSFCVLSSRGRRRDRLLRRLKIWLRICFSNHTSIMPSSKPLIRKSSYNSSLTWRRLNNMSFPSSSFARSHRQLRVCSLKWPDSNHRNLKTQLALIPFN